MCDLVGYHGPIRYQYWGRTNYWYIDVSFLYLLKYQYYREGEIVDIVMYQLSLSRHYMSYGRALILQSTFGFDGIVLICVSWHYIWFPPPSLEHTEDHEYARLPCLHKQGRRLMASLIRDVCWHSKTNRNELMPTTWAKGTEGGSKIWRVGFAVKTRSS